MAGTNTTKLCRAMQTKFYYEFQMHLKYNLLPDSLQFLVSAVCQDCQNYLVFLNWLTMTLSNHHRPHTKINNGFHILFGLGHVTQKRCS